jgi:hypothetical protein
MMTGLDPILGIGEEMLAEPRTDAHDDDSVGVVFSVRDHEETHILTVSSILLRGAFLQRRTSHLKRTNKVKICIASPKSSSLVFLPLFLFCSPLTVQHSLKRFHGL